MSHEGRRHIGKIASPQLGELQAVLKNTLKILFDTILKYEYEISDMSLQWIWKFGNQ